MSGQTQNAIPVLAIASTVLAALSVAGRREKGHVMRRREVITTVRNLGAASSLRVSRKPQDPPAAYPGRTAQLIAGAAGWS